MKKEFKIVICGGGSTYTAGIVKNLLEEEELKIKELWLYDIDQERQEKVSLIVKEVVKDLRPSLELKISTDEEEAFTDADFIMAQMRVGGLKMRVKDEQISFANSEKNLNEMDAGQNRSKGDKAMTDWLDKPH